MSKLLDAYSIQFKRVITFGDDHNDVGLFNTCGRSVAMGNAVKELKDIASEVADSNDADGVAVVLERILV
jgi:hydroxymethylpyrimidine pyrophosphatase-like HAD family hydrolase